MAQVLIKTGYLSYNGFLYRAGDVVDVANAEDIVSRSEGRIILPGHKKTAAKTPKPAKENATEKPEEDGGEELASLPEADPAAAVKE